jgi:hypothetical protein
MGGFLLAPDDELMQKSLAIFEADWERSGGHPRLGRHLGRLLIETGFEKVETSASLEVYSDPEGRKFKGQIAASHMTNADFAGRIIEQRLATANELEAMKKAWQNWQELPGAFYALSFGEAIGWKA